MHGLVASAFKAAYVSAKHGVVGLVKALALEGAPHGITANAAYQSDPAHGEALRASGLLDAVTEMRSRVFEDAELKLPYRSSPAGAPPTTPNT